MTKSKSLNWIKCLTFVFTVTVVIRGVQLINVGNLLTEITDVVSFNYYLFSPEMRASLLMRIIQLASLELINPFTIMASLNLIDVLMITSALLIIELNRKYNRKNEITTVFFYLFVFSCFSLLFIFLSIIFSSPIENAFFLSGIIYLVLAGVYIGVSINQFFKILRLNEAS